MTATSPSLSAVRTAREDAADPLAWLLCAAALVLGTARFVRLGEWSLWLDEALTLADSLHEQPVAQKNPLGYLLYRGYLDGLAWLELFMGHPSELQLRLPSAVLGWLAIPLTYWVFAPFAGRRAGAAAALLVSLSSWHVYWSQTARFYTLAQDLSLLGAGCVLRGLWRPSTKAIAVGLAFTGAACLAHLSAAFLLPPLVVAPLVLRVLRSDVPGTRGWPLYLLVLAAVAGGLAGGAHLAEAWINWRAIKGAGTPLHLILTAGFFVTPLLGAGALAGALLALARRRPFDVVCLLVVLGVLASAAVASLFARVSAQYVFILLPWIAALAGLPLARTGTRESRTLAWAYLALLALPAAVGVGLYLTVRKGERPEWRAAYEYVFDHREDGDLVMGMEAPVGEYYLAPGETDLRDQRALVYLDRWRTGVPAQWARFGRRMWFVLNFEQLEDWDRPDREHFEELLREQCRLQASFPLVVESRDLSVYVFLRE